MRETPEAIKALGITYRIDDFREALKEAERLALELDDAMNATPKSPQMTGMPRSGNQTTLDIQVEIIESARQRFEAARDRMLERLTQLEDVIDSLPDREQQRVLYFRHIYRMKWCDVAEKMHWSERTVQRLHNKAIQTLEDMQKGEKI